MRISTACVLLVVASAAMCTVPSFAQSDTTQRTITILAPEVGILYVRYGSPGGVQIRSRRGGDEAQVPARAEAVDLERLARVFDRQGLDLYAERLRRGDEVVVVLRDAATDAVADTLSEEEARDLVESFGGADAPPSADGVPPPSADGAPPPAGDTVPSARDTALVARIERSILDEGLFRSLQVHFEFDRSELLPSSRRTIESVAEVMRRHSNLELEVAGHTDAIGTDAYNERLSQRRAESVARALETLGIAPNRLQAKGYGEQRPILTNETPTGRALNRRVEFSVVAGSSVDREIRE